MKTIMVILKLIALFPILAWAEAPECPIRPISVETSNLVASINVWLRSHGHKIKSIDDFVCCLPKEYRDRYIVAHSSVSAQSSHYHSPRVIMFFEDQAALSISGGDQKLPQSMSVEIMQNNKRNEVVEFFDLEFDSHGRAKMSEKNPEKCMNCHTGGGRPARNSNSSLSKLSKI